jgi:CubicO group peptidase (beta-lactamase class C family)
MMNRGARAGYWLGGAAVLGLSCAAQEPRVPLAANTARLAVGQTMPVVELEAFVDGVVVPAMARDHVAGAVVAIVQDGAIRLLKGYGFADLESARRVDPNETLFRIGSITKTFTWISLMRRVEGGLLDIDDPVNDHLPPKLQIPGDAFAEPIRVRDLLTHSPGFEDRVFGSVFVRDPHSCARWATTSPKSVRLAFASPETCRPTRTTEPLWLARCSSTSRGGRGKMSSKPTSCGRSPLSVPVLASRIRHARIYRNRSRRRLPTASRKATAGPQRGMCRDSSSF